jgi:gluconokinase
MGKVHVIMGVCGCGKTTAGEALAEATSGVFVEGDSYHSFENVEKMRSGRALNDADRQGWLESLAEVIREHADQPGWCFVGCSALKESYRDILRRGDPNLGFIYLHGEESVLRQRMGAREGHYMPPGLLDSQLATLEEPAEAIRVSIDQSPEMIVRDVLDQLARI